MGVSRFGFGPRRVALPSRADMGLPPTGKFVTYNEIFIFRFVNGRVVETWGVVDVLSQMKQIGVIRS